MRKVLERVLFSGDELPCEPDDIAVVDAAMYGLVENAGGRVRVSNRYGGERFVVELKIWRGNACNERGEKQLAAYLDYFHLKKGYMLSYNFNKARTQGIRRIQIGGRELVEAVVQEKRKTRPPGRAAGGS